MVTGSADQAATEWVFGINEVALRLGVSPSTVRSWDRRYGVAPTARTPGGHRRYSAADLARLRRLLLMVEAGVPTGHAAAVLLEDGAVDESPAEARQQLGAALPADSPTARRLRDAMVRLDAGAIGAVTAATIKRTGVVSAWQDLMSPALTALGERWSVTGSHVEVEHVTTAALDTVLRHHAANVEGTPTRRVLLVATPGEAHVLPLAATAAALADRGVRAVIGGDLPIGALRMTIEQVRPHSVLVWSRQRATAQRAVLELVGRLAGRVWAAGPGWPAELTDDIAHVVTLIDAIEALSA